MAPKQRLLKMLSSHSSDQKYAVVNQNYTGIHSKMGPMISQVTLVKRRTYQTSSKTRNSMKDEGVLFAIYLNQWGRPRKAIGKTGESYLM